MSIDRATLLAALKANIQTINVTGIGEVKVAELTVAEMDELRALVKADAQDDSFGLFVAIRSIKEDGGAPMFTDADMAELRADSNTRVQALVTAALTANGLIVAEAKNSPPSDGSVSV